MLTYRECEVEDLYQGTDEQECLYMLKMLRCVIPEEKPDGRIKR
jgi:hypothetical protein